LCFTPLYNRTFGYNQEENNLTQRPHSRKNIEKQCDDSTGAGAVFF
jgi:hypothetical protein